MPSGPVLAVTFKRTSSIDNEICVETGWFQLTSKLSITWLTIVKGVWPLKMTSLEHPIPLVTHPVLQIWPPLAHLSLIEISTTSLSSTTATRIRRNRRSSTIPCFHSCRANVRNTSSEDNVKSRCCSEGNYRFLSLCILICLGLAIGGAIWYHSLGHWRDEAMGMFTVDTAWLQVVERSTAV